MKNKYNFIVLFIIGFILINLEFAMYSSLSLFGVISLVLISPLILLAIISMNHYEVHGEWKIYVLTVALMLVYGAYANIYQVYIVLVGTIFVWFYRTYLIDLHKTDLLVGIFVSYLALFSSLSFYFILVYNLNINLMMLLVLNTLVPAAINSLVTYIALLIFTKNLEEDDHF